MAFDYFTLGEAEQYAFYRVPKLLITGEQFRTLSMEAKLLYGILLDANLQRDIILPSEKAFAYKMKYEAMRRNIKKKKLHPEDEYSNSLIGKRTVEILSEEGFDSPKQIQRYLKIADMIPEMLEKLDYGLISFHPAFEIAFLKPNEQRMLLDAMDYAQSAPSVSQAQRIKKLSQMNKLTLEAMQPVRN